MTLEKLTSEELEMGLRYVEETLGPVNAKLLRDHIAALEAERDEACRQGQADHRALHDALGWAHGWHGKELPPPWRAVTALIAERDAYKRDLEALRAGWPPSTRGANQVERCRVVDAEAALAAVHQRAEDDERLALEMVEARGSVTDKTLAVVRYVVGGDADERAQSPGKTATYPVPLLLAEPATAEPFAKVDEALKHLDAYEWRATRTRLSEADPAREALTRLERRMGAMTGVVSKEADGLERAGLVEFAARLRAALTDAPPGFTLEEVREVLKARLHHSPLADAMRELAALRQKG